MTKTLKACLVAGIVASTSALNAEIVLTDDLSLYGYIDMAATDFDAPGDTFDASVAEVELGFDFTTDIYSSVAELSYDGMNVGFETVTITYAASESLSFTAGNILSYLGWETYDATGLYQFSYAYRGFSPLYPAYAVGASVDYVTDAFSFGVWVGEGGSEEVSLEVAGKFTGVEGMTLFVGYADDPTYETFNVWGSYEVSDLTFALEYVDHTNEITGGDTKGYLAMANYAIGDFGFTVRYSVQDDDFIAEDWELLTFSPGYAFSDNLFALAEWSEILDGGGGVGHQWAIELIYSF